MAAAILDADEQNRFVAQLARAGIEDRMGRIGPVFRREDRIVGMAMKQLGVQAAGFDSINMESFLT